VELTIGQYRLSLPNGAAPQAELHGIEFGSVYTIWKIDFHDHQFFIHLARREPEELANLILSQTKQLPEVTTVEFNGITGVRHGEFYDHGAFIDWWFRSGDLTICVTLRGSGPTPSADVRTELESIVESIELAPASW